MTLTTYISASVFIFLSALVMKDKVAKEQSGSLYETKWVLKRMHNVEGSEDVSANAYIIFHSEKRSAAGKGGCNSFGSSINVSGNNISLTNIFSTKMYCEGVQEQENAFLKKLGTCTRFVITGNLLSLYNGEKLLLEFSSGKE